MSLVLRGRFRMSPATRDYFLALPYEEFRRSSLWLYPMIWRWYRDRWGQVVVIGILQNL